MTSSSRRSPCTSQPMVLIKNTQAKSGISSSHYSAPHPVRRAALNVRQEGVAAAVLESNAHETGLTDRVTFHLRRLVLEGRQFRS